MKNTNVKMFSGDFLDIVAGNDAAIVFEKSLPLEQGYRRETITIRHKHGGALTLNLPGGYEGILELPKAIFEDWKAAGLIKEDGPEDERGITIFRLTRDGKSRGQNRKTVLLSIARSIRDDWEGNVSDKGNFLDQAEKLERKARLFKLADTIEQLAAITLSEPMPYSEFEAVLTKLHKDGFFPSQEQIANVVNEMKTA